MTTKFTRWLLVVVVLAFGSGCAKQEDWIQRTLALVDVTGTWVRTEGPRFELKLEQRGSKVTGSMRAYGVLGPGSVSGAVEGSVDGDVFRFKQTSGTTGNRGPVNGEMRVSGDEMSGRPWGVLRRVDSSRPSS